MAGIELRDVQFLSAPFSLAECGAFWDELAQHLHRGVARVLADLPQRHHAELALPDAPRDVANGAFEAYARVLKGLAVVDSDGVPAADAARALEVGGGLGVFIASSAEKTPAESPPRAPSDGAGGGAGVGLAPASSVTL